MLQAAKSSGEQTQAWKRWEGQTVGGAFPLREFLGRSEASAVFLTERQGQRAAIKLVQADGSTAEPVLERWKQVAQLSHPHLIRLFEMGRCRIDDTDLLFVVEEYAEENLAQVIPQRALTPAEVRELLPPALDALAYLHSRGFVHAHIKPANVMAADDQLKLSSDRLCRIGNPSQQAQPSAYDPPESANGVTSPAGDIWRLGVTLWEALTQKLPRWRGSEQQPLLLAAMPTQFRELVIRCLQRDPQRRCSVDDITAWIRDPLNHPLMASRLQMTVRSQPAQTGAPKKRFARSTVAVTVGLAVIVLLAILLVAVRLNHQSESPVGLTSASGQPNAQPNAEKPRPSKPKASISTKGHDRLASADTGAPLSSSLALQSNGSGLTQADVVSQVLPDAPQKAIDTITGHFWVRVRVQVDSSGNVVGADFVSRGPSAYFANLALDAARNWKFAPRTTSQRRQGVVQFQFEHGSIKAMPVR